MNKGTRHPLLFQPLQVGSHTLRNRFVMGSMHTGLEDLNDCFERLTEFYRLRAEEGASLIVTGGISPNITGTYTGAATLNDESQIASHRKLTTSIRKHGSLICMQILHLGRYANHNQAVAPSALRSPISPVRPHAMTESEILETISDYVHCSELARRAGYHGVEINGAEGFLISLFFSPATNLRVDKWGGSLANRLRFAKQIVEGIRRQNGPDFLIIFRLSIVDFIESGMRWEEVVGIAQDLEKNGVDIFSTAIGWNESKIPTVSSLVPPAVFAGIVGAFKKQVSIPVIANHRIHHPNEAEHILQAGQADLISMSRPFLADPYFVKKTQEGRSDEINLCIACNQSCLDRAFAYSTSQDNIVSCLVNPFACHETLWTWETHPQHGKIAVVGAGPAGLVAARILAQRGFYVTLFEASPNVGGHFRLAQKIPSKFDYQKTIAYFEAELHRCGVKVITSKCPSAEDLLIYDHVFVATGVHPAKSPFVQSPDARVMSYADLLLNEPLLGNNIVVIGGGGIGMDVAEYLTCNQHLDQKTRFFKTWGIDESLKAPGALIPPQPPSSPRKVWILEKEKGLIGRGLGRTTVAHRRDLLQRNGVVVLTGVQDLMLTDRGVSFYVEGQLKELTADQVILCNGVERDSETPRLLLQDQIPFSLIGSVSGTEIRNAADSIRHAMEVAIQFKLDRKKVK